MRYRFFLDGTGVEQPIGFNDLELSLIRNGESHGIAREASTRTLLFHGSGAALLRAAKAAQGVSANVLFVAEQRCDDWSDWETVLRGRLNFGRYRETCGRVCTVSIPMEEESCELLLLSRIETKVDVDALFAFDKLNGLVQYSGLAMEKSIPAKQLKTEVSGSVLPQGDQWVVDVPGSITPDPFYVKARPDYAVQRYNSIATGNLTPINGIDYNEQTPLTPQLLMEENPQCTSGDIAYTFRTKGRIRLTEDQSTLLSAVQVVRWNGEGSLTADGVVLQSSAVFTGPYTANTVVEFDSTLSGSVNLSAGEGLYCYIAATGFRGDSFEFHAEFDVETDAEVTAVKQCPPSTAKVYMVHELLSRVAESITNNCCRAKSSYYGRTDSQPFAFDEDGCGGLRSLTSGLKLRKAENDKFFVSLRDLLRGLRCIDNIGWDVVEDSTAYTRWVLRVEDFTFFYQNTVLLILDNVPQAQFEVEESLYYARIVGGYKKWETEAIDGLQELNSGREYRTSLETVQGVLDVQSEIVAGAMAIERTRQAQFADTGGADTTYDNDTFILCMHRDAYGIEVEVGNATNTENIFSPTTLLNYRISPARNALRWFRAVAAGYITLADSASKMFFSAGTGNIAAKGEVNTSYERCKQENTVLSESQDLFLTNFAYPEDYSPIWKNEYAIFDYPLSVKQYNTIKANPYGMIRFRCGTYGAFQDGWIVEIKWKPMSGTASFKLRLKR